MTGTIGERRFGQARRSVRLVAAFAAAALVATACGNSDDGNGAAAGSGNKPFKILAVLGTSGIGAQPAAALLAGVNAAIGVINDNGGINGRTVEPKTLDDQSDPSRAVSQLQGELGDSKPDLLFSGSTSDETIAMLPLANSNKIPYMNTNAAAAVGDPSKFPYAFSTVGVASKQATFIVEQIKAKGVTNVGLLFGNNPVGKTISAIYEEAIKANGMTSHLERYEAADLDMSAPLSRIQGQNPGAVIYYATGPAAGYVLKSREKVGMMSTPFYGDTAVSTSNFASLVTAAQAEGALVNCYQVSVKQAEADQLPGKTELMKRLDAAGVKYTSSLFTYALAYDGILAAANSFIAIGPDKVGDSDAWRASMEADPAQKFPTAVAEKFGWTRDVHFRGELGGFILVPADTPLAGSQFEPATTP